MTLAEHRDPEFVDGLTLQSICRGPGPFLSIYLPSHYPGGSGPSAALRLKTMLRIAATELAQRRHPGPVEDLLAPFESLLRDAAMLGGSADTVIFGSAGDFHLLRPAAPVGARLVVATHPHITPLLPHIVLDRECFVLLVSRKGLRLGRWRAGGCQEIPLPPSIPRTLKEFGDFDQPDHDLESRSAGGGSKGRMHRIRFGTSSDSEGADLYLHNYLRLADRELAVFLGGAPLVPIGVADDLAAYRLASEYPRILQGVHTGVERLTWPEIGAIAHDALRNGRCLEAEKALSEVQEATRRDHVASGVRKVLEAAYAGRVHKLILARDTEYQDLLGPLCPIAEAQLEGPQDLLNAAAVETIRGGGEVHVVDPQRLAGLGPMAAILRYSLAGARGAAL